MTYTELIQQIKNETVGKLSEKEISFMQRDFDIMIKSYCKNLQSSINTSKLTSSFSVNDNGDLVLAGGPASWQPLHKITYKTSDNKYQQIYIVDSKEEVYTTTVPCTYIDYGNTEAILTVNFAPINVDDDELIVNKWSTITNSAVIDSAFNNNFVRMFTAYCKMHMIEDPNVQIYVQLYNQFKELFLKDITDTSFIDTGILNVNQQIDV